MTALAPQRMNPAITLGRCTQCDETAYVVELKRASDPSGTACGTCLELVLGRGER